METPKKLKSSVAKCNTPTFQNLSYRETFHFGSETLHRSFSYNQLWSPGENGEGASITQVTVSCCKTPNNAIKPNKRKKLTYEDIPRKKRKTILIESKSKFTGVMFLTICAIGTALIGLNSMRCGDKVMNNGFQEKLSMSINGQSEAITNILTTINDAKFESEVNMKHMLMVFLGPVGVGKSYAASIIKEYFPNQNSILFTTANEVIMKQKLHPPLSICWTLIIIEDCKEHQVNDILNILDSYVSKPHTLVLLVLTSNHFWESKRQLHHMVQKKIYFSPLSFDAIVKCFIIELENYRFKLENHEITDLVNDHIKPINESSFSPGCKLVKERIIKYFAEIGYVP